MDGKIKLAKGAIKFIIGTSVSKVAVRLIKSHVPTKSISEEIQLMIGAWTIGAMMADKAVDWANYKFDESLERLKNFKSEAEEPTE